VKVWIFKGEVFNQPELIPVDPAEGQAPAAPTEATA
jgi:ribosomal protein S3